MENGKFLVSADYSNSSDIPNPLPPQQPLSDDEGSESSNSCPSGICRRLAHLSCHRPQLERRDKIRSLELRPPIPNYCVGDWLPTHSRRL
jgi:hypothetical protein